MANGNQSSLPAGFVLDQPVEQPIQPQVQPVPLPAGFVLDEPQAEEKSLFERGREFVTGSERTTPEIEALQEIGAAPELNALSLDSFQASLGLIVAGNEEGAKAILKEQIPDVKFKEDAKGNTIVQLPSGEFALNKPGFSPQDLVKGIADIAAFSPAAKIGAAGKNLLSRLGLAGAGAGATQAVIETAEQELGGEKADFEQVAIAAGLGGGGQLAGDAISAAFRATKGVVSPGAKQVLEAGEAANVPVLTTDVVPPEGIAGGLARQLGERIPFIGTGEVRAGQKAAREKAVRDFTDSLPITTDKQIIDSLNTQTKKVRRAAGNRLEAIKTQLDTTGPVSLTNTNSAISQAIDRLDSVQIGKDTATLKKLQGISEGAQEQHVFSMLRDARTAVREMGDAVDPTGRSQLPSKSKAAIKSIEQAMTKDLDSAVLSNIGEQGLRRYKDADRVWAGEASKLTKSRLKNVLDKGDITPEVVNNLLLSRKPSEVKLLHDSLTPAGKEAARSSIIKRALEKAGGLDELSPTRFTNELKKLRANTEIFFKGDSKRQLRGLEALLRETKRAQEAGAVTPTGQSLTALAGIAAGSQVGLVPSILGAGSAGAAARIYESPVVRNFLLKVANTPRNSIEFDRLINETTPKINAVLQEERQRNLRDGQ